MNQETKETIKLRAEIHSITEYFKNYKLQLNNIDQKEYEANEKEIESNIELINKFLDKLNNIE